jgi:hypothetical protein
LSQRGDGPLRTNSNLGIFSQQGHFDATRGVDARTHAFPDHNGSNFPKNKINKLDFFTDSFDSIHSRRDECHSGQNKSKIKSHETDHSITNEFQILCTDLNGLQVNMH